MGLTWTWDYNKQIVPVQNSPAALEQLFSQFTEPDPAVFAATEPAAVQY